MRNRTSLLAVATIALPVLFVAGCQSDTSQSSEAVGTCRPEAAASLAGRTRISDAEAMRLTGASMVRQIRPGDGVTLDYRQERVTVETDPKTGRIVRAMCG